MPRRKQRFVDIERAAQAAAASKSAPAQPALESWPKYLSLREGARYLGHKTHYILYRWIKAGRLSVNKSTRSWTVCRDDLDKLWREGAETAA